MNQDDELISGTDKTFEYIFETIIDGVCVIDTETMKFSLVNQAMCQMLGYSSEELRNISIYDFPTKASLPHIEIFFSQLLNKKIDQIKDIPILTKNGKLLYTDIAASPMQYNSRPHLVATFTNITDRREAENELQRKEELLRTTLNTTADGILLVDNNDKIVNINKRLIEMWKVPEHILDSGDDKMLLRFVTDQVADPTEFIKKVKYLYDTDMESFDEILFKDGRTFERYSSPLISEEIKFGRVWDFKDITARKHAEEELHKNEAIMKTLFDVAPVGIALLVDRVHIKINSTLSKLTGYTPEEILGHSTEMMYFTKEEFDRTSTMVYPEVKEKGFCMIETILRRKDGSVFNALLCIRSIDPNDMSAGVVVISLDITDRKRIEEALKESEEKYRTLVDNMQDAAYRCDLNGNLVFVSPSAAKMLGCHSPESMIGLNIGNDFYYHPEEREELTKILKKNSKVTHYDVTLKRIDTGEPVLVSTNSQFYRDKEGNIVGIEGIFNDITERKKAEQALRESEEKYHSLVDNMQDAAYRSDLNGILIYVTPSAARILGYSSVDEILGLNIAKDLYYSPEEREKTLRIMKEQGKLTHFEVTLKRKDGLPVIISTNSQFYRDKDGKIIGIEGVYSDITDRKKAEDALKKSEALFSGIFQASPAGILVLVNRVPWKINRSFCRMSGYSEEELLGHSTRLFYFNDEEFNRVGLAYKQMDSEGLSMVESRFRRKDGSVLNVLVCLSHINPDDQEEGDIAVTLDITDLKQVEFSLKKSESFLSKIFDVSPVGITLLADRTFIKVNNYICRMSGYSEQELLGQNTRIFYSNDEDHKIIDELYEQMEKEGISIKESRIKHKNGMILDTILSLSPFDIINKTAGAALTILDITEQKKIETERIHLEEMLLHSQKLESLGRLAGGIAHDFNNILTAIMGNTEMAMHQLDPSCKPYSRLAVVKNATEGAANLTRQLLAFSRKQIIEPKIIKLDYLIERVYKMITTLIGENIKLHIIPCKKISPIKADPGQIEQVVINLAANARDAMPDGGELTIETSDVYLDEKYSLVHPNVLPGYYVMIAVTDTGTGMNNDTLEHIFEPFFTTKTTGRGTGLGLATVYGIVKQNGGTIEVYSEISQGTVFKVYFPVSSQPPNDSPEIQEASVMPAGTETILIAEDKDEVLEFCHDILVRLGYKVLTAGSGEEALSISENYQDIIHLFMTDIILPGMNGRAAAEKLSDLRPGIKILYNSGYTAEVIDKQGILEKGINFLSKPFTSQKLAAKIRELLDRKA